jgi:hypothetical protein
MHHVKQVVEGRVAAPNVRRITKFSANNTKDPIIVFIAKKQFMGSMVWTEDIR